MAKPKETEKGEDGTEDARKSPSRVIVTAIISLAAAALSGAGALFLPLPHLAEPTASPSSQTGSDESETGIRSPSHADEGKASASRHGKKSMNDDLDALKVENVEVQIVGDAAFVEFRSLVVSIQPIGRSKHLRVALVLETEPDYSASVLEKAHHLKDAFNTYLRAVDATEFEDPSAMSRIRAQLLRRAQVVAPYAHIRGVLITEFVLT